MNGLLLVDKPEGLSSYDVIRQLKRVLPKGTKIGHAGTLDPLATGLLLILIGSATKRATGLLKLDKVYDTTVRLGATSATDDREGPISVVSSRETENGGPTEENVEQVLKQFQGEIEQLPPAHSAIKVGGQRAYKLARAGRTLELTARPVIVEKLEILDYDYPDLKIRAEVGSGTYIRSLARDIGQKLGVGGYVYALCRTAVGTYILEDAIDISGITCNDINNSLLPI